MQINLRWVQDYKGEHSDAERRSELKEVAAHCPPLAGAKVVEWHR